MQTRIPAPAEANKQQSHSAQHPAQLLAEQQSAFEDHRPQAAQLTSLQAKMNGSAQAQQMRTLQTQIAGGDVAQRESLDEPLQAQGDGGAVQREELATAAEAPKPNNTGLPDNLKSGIESLSGMSMDHVKVHYNSSQPAQLNAHAYAQGSEIHVAPGQEQHVPHEAWHVVQQAQGRVKPTMQMKMGVPVNDDVGLETEADVMGAKAHQAGQNLTQLVALSSAGRNIQLQEIAQAKSDESGSSDPGAELTTLVEHLEHMRTSTLSLGSDAASELKVDVFASKLAALKEVASSNDVAAQAAVLDAIQKELRLAGVPVSTLSAAKVVDQPVQRMSSSTVAQRLTGIEIGVIVGTVIGIGALTYGIYRFCFGGAGPAPVAALGYAATPIPIALAGNLLQIAELERGSAPAVAFTGISSCLGIFRRNGGNISAVHLPLIDATGNLVTMTAIPNLLLAANTALGGGGTFYLVGERDVWLGSGAGAHFVAIQGAFGGVHRSFGSGNYSASIDGATNETVITNNGVEVLRGT